jgi:hypothetical protein
MYIFKTALRVETNNNPAKQLGAILKEPLPAQAAFAGSDKHGDWYRVALPASVWAIAIKSDDDITVGYYHSPASADEELKEALNVKTKRRSV